MGIRLNIEVRRVDSQGRIALPSEWRKRTLQASREVIIMQRDDHLLVRPRLEGDLTRFFDAFTAEVPPESFKDYKQLKRALLGSSRQ